MVPQNFQDVAATVSIVSTTPRLEYDNVSTGSRQLGGDRKPGGTGADNANIRSDRRRRNGGRVLIHSHCR